MRYERECQEQQHKSTTTTTLQQQQQQHCRLPLIPRLLISIDRSKSVEEAYENVNLAIDLHEKGDQYIVGIDLGGNPLQNDFRHFQGPLSNKARAAGLQLTLHCGEVKCGDVDSDSFEEAESLIAFRPHRLGHALLLPQSLQLKLLQAPISIECCPTSNVMTLELVSHSHYSLIEGHRSHPQLAFWLANDYPFSISTDDSSGAFHTDPCKELLLLSMAWNLGIERVTTIIRQSIDHAFCDDATKRLLRQRMGPYF